MNCPYCSADQNSLKPKTWHKGEFFLFLCGNCDNKFVLPQPSNEELYTYYQNSYLNRTEEHVSKKEAVLGSFYAKLISRFNPKASLVYEVGASEGNLLYGLKNRGYEVTGFELSEHSAKLGEKVLGVKIIAGKIPVHQDKKANVLISSHVIEHLRDPKNEFLAYAENLTPGGILIATTPNVGSLLSKIFKNYHPWFSVPDHLFYFDKENISKDFRAAGFKINKVFTRNDKFSVLLLFLFSVLNYLKERRSPTKPQAWKHLLQTPEARPLSKKRLKGFIYKNIDRLLFVPSKLLELTLGIFNLNDELWIIAEKL
ncbi:MAG: class I SAM-dependent methyltransferase [bacterium]|nr:class I SAM-dependent methyltransferase [bacterium]